LAVAGFVAVAGLALALLALAGVAFAGDWAVFAGLALGEADLVVAVLVGVARDEVDLVAVLAAAVFAGVALVPVDFVVAVVRVAVSLPAAVVRDEADLAVVCALAVVGRVVVDCAAPAGVAADRDGVGWAADRDGVGWVPVDRRVATVGSALVERAVVVRDDVFLEGAVRVLADRAAADRVEVGVAARPAVPPADVVADRERAAADRDALALDPAVAAFFAEVRREVVVSRTPESEALVLRAGMLAVVCFRVREVAAATRSPSRFRAGLSLLAASRSPAA
jgi:hypothetical protein